MSVSEGSWACLAQVLPFQCRLLGIKYSFSERQFVLPITFTHRAFWCSCIYLPLKLWLQVYKITPSFATLGIQPGFMCDRKTIYQCLKSPSSLTLSIISGKHQNFRPGFRQDSIFGMQAKSPFWAISGLQMEELWLKLVDLHHDIQQPSTKHIFKSCPLPFWLIKQKCLLCYEREGINIFGI